MVLTTGGTVISLNMANEHRIVLDIGPNLASIFRAIVLSVMLYTIGRKVLKILMQ